MAIKKNTQWYNGVEHHIREDEALGSVVVRKNKIKTHVKQKDVTYSVVINIPINRLNIDTVQKIEECLDKELGSEGFQRQSGAKGDVIVFNYWEFGCPGV